MNDSARSVGLRPERDAESVNRLVDDGSTTTGQPHVFGEDDMSELRRKTDRQPDIEVNLDDPCKCGISDTEGVVVNYDIMWGDGVVIHDPARGGCGKFIRHWDRG